MQIVRHVDAEEEVHAVRRIPAIQVLGLREVGVATNEHLSEAAGTTHADGSIDALAAAPSCDGRLPERLRRLRISPVLANDTTSGW